MIERSLVYIHSTRPHRRFIGCGALIEGGYIATCRHILRIATGESRPGEGELTLEIEYPRAYRGETTFRAGAKLADNCSDTHGPAPDLVLLLPDEIPNEAITLQLAHEDKFESGAGFALIGLAGRNAANPNAPEDVRIDGKIADHRNAKGLRQFTGISDTSYWSARGSSGSPVFIERGQQLAGIICKSELGTNEGDTKLQVAFIVPATTIRPYLVGLTTRQAARTLKLPLDDWKPILEMIGAQDLSIADIPGRVKQFVEAARAHGAQPVKPSNEGADIETTIGVSRKKVANLDTVGARAVLQDKIDEEQEMRVRRLVPLLKERAAVESLALDHNAAKATLADVARLAPDDVWARIKLGDLWRVTGSSD
ncbi:MAG: trypsin-like peptidase domain-containing protein, partial [Stellaceae bacterium]